MSSVNERTGHMSPNDFGVTDIFEKMYCDIKRHVLDMSYVKKRPLNSSRGQDGPLLTKIVNVCNLTLGLVSQAIFAIFTVTLITGMHPMFIPKNTARLNGPIPPNNNTNMINQIILNPVQPN